MRSIIAATLFASLIAFLQGMYVMVKNPHAAANRLFAVLSGLFSLWFIGTALQLSSATEADARAWFTFSTVVRDFVEPVSVHFFLALTENKLYRKRRWLVPLFYAPAAVLAFLNTFTGFGAVGFVQTGFGWTYTLDYKSAWTALAGGYALAYILSGPVILFRWSRESSDPQRKAQSRIIIYFLLIGVLLTGASAVLSTKPGFGYLPSISHIFVIFWLVGIAFAILRHKLMAISPSDMAITIFTAMADGVLLIDREGIVRNANPAACEILRTSASSLVGSSVEGMLSSAFTKDGSRASWGIARSVRDLETTYATGTNPSTTWPRISLPRWKPCSGGTIRSSAWTTDGFHSDCRTDGLDRSHRRVGAAGRVPAAPRMAEDGSGNHPGGQSLCPSIPGPGPGGKDNGYPE